MWVSKKKKVEEKNNSEIPIVCKSEAEMMMREYERKAKNTANLLTLRFKTNVLRLFKI